MVSYVLGRCKLEKTVFREPFVSIIILNYNGMVYVEQCLGTVLKSNYSNFEVILVDNASTDESFRLAKELFSSNEHLKFVSNDSNLGYAEGNNRGVAFCNPMVEYIIFLNIDTKVDPMWIKNLVSTVEKNESVGAAQCKLIQLNNPTKIDSLGGLTDYLGFCYIRASGHGDQIYDHVEEIFYAEGAALLIKAKVARQVKIKKTSVFDPNFFCLHEDLDLCWRVRLQGYKVLFVPSSVVYHARGGTHTKDCSPLLVFHQTKNRFTVMISNYELKSLLRYLPILLFMEVNAGVFLIPKNPSRGMAILKGIGWAVKNLKQIFERRQIIQGCRKIGDDSIIEQMEKPHIGSLFRALAR